MTQGDRGTAVQGENGSAAHAGNTTAGYNKNTGEVASYNSATGKTRSGNVDNAGTSNWQHDCAQRQGAALPEFFARSAVRRRLATPQPRVDTAKAARRWRGRMGEPGAGIRAR